MEKIEEREEKCDVRISDYILAHYKEQQMYYDPYHPTREVLHEIGRRIVSKLGYTGEYVGNRYAANDGGELFIYGCVRRALGLEFEQSYIKRYDHSSTLHGRAINLREYIEEYRQWHYPLDQDITG